MGTTEDFRNTAAKTKRLIEKGRRVLGEGGRVFWAANAGIQEPNQKREGEQNSVRMKGADRSRKRGTRPSKNSELKGGAEGKSPKKLGMQKK